MVKQPYIYCCMALSLTPGPGMAEPVGNLSSPCRKLVWGRTDNRIKTVCNEDRLHWKDAKNAVELHRFRL